MPSDGFSRDFWRQDGQLVFEGRSDRQSKLKGLRIDLDDLSVRMATSDDACMGVAVTPVSGQAGYDHIVAVAQPASLDMAKFVQAVRGAVPLYALPRLNLAMDKFPTTKIGKLDYKKMTEISPRPQYQLSVLHQLLLQVSQAVCFLPIYLSQQMRRLRHMKISY